MENKKSSAAIGAVCGFINGIFGSGGGTVAVPLLRKSGLSRKEAQATSLSAMFFLSAVSAGIYLHEGRVALSDAFGFIPGGMVGAVFAALVFRKMKPKLLGKIFGGTVVFFAAKSLMEACAEWIF